MKALRIFLSISIGLLLIGLGAGQAQLLPTNPFFVASFLRSQAAALPTPLISYNGVTNSSGEMVDASGNLNAKGFPNLPTLTNYVDGNSVTYPNSFNIDTTSGYALSNSFSPSGKWPTVSGTLAIKMLGKSTNISSQMSSLFTTAGNRNSLTLPLRRSGYTQSPYVQWPVFTGTNQSGVLYSVNIPSTYGAAGTAFTLRNDDLFHWYVFSWGPSTTVIAFDSTISTNVNAVVMTSKIGADNNADYATSFKLVIGQASAELVHAVVNKWQLYSTQLTSNQIAILVTQ